MSDGILYDMAKLRKVQLKPSSEIDKKVFMKYFDMFPKGNPEKTYLLGRYHIATKKDFFGNKVTWKKILSAWREYIEWCRKEEKEEKYIKQMLYFIHEEEYNTNFNVKLKDPKVDDKLSEWFDSEKTEEDGQEDN